MSEMYRSHVVSWNLTKKCNLRCEHCYISAGRINREEAQGELTTEECLRVVDQLAEINPEALLILTGGEPLLRRDVFEIAGYASKKGLWPVVGTNGVLLTRDLIERMIGAGIKGVSLSLDGLDAEEHDRFRGIPGAFENTVNGSRLLDEMGLPYIIQTTVGEHNREDVREIAAKAYDLGARVFNLYFLVPTGRGTFISDITRQEYEDSMAVLKSLQVEYEGRMVVNSKCAPHYQRFLYQQDKESPFLKTFGSGAGGCPAGTHYMGIRPDGDVSPCPYLPVYGGNLRETDLRTIWNDSEVFQKIRKRNELSEACGACEFNSVCGGCRARAYGSTGDYMATDAWCGYEPGQYGFEPISFDDKTVYGLDVAESLVWTDEAKERLGYIPSFVRGMVSGKVEAYAREKGERVITAELLHEARERAMDGRVGRVPPFVRRLMQMRRGESGQD